MNSVGLSSHAEETLEPLEHMVHTQTDPAGQFSVVGTLSPSDCNSVGPVGLPPHTEKTLEPLEHMVLTQTDPAGQCAAVGTLSPSDCYPVGPVGPYVAGGPAVPDVYITDPNSLTHMVRIPPDPDGQDAAATGTPSHLTVTLLALLACVLQGALLAQIIVYLLWNRASTWF